VFNGYNSIAIANVGTKFDVGTKTNVGGLSKIIGKIVIPSELTFEKIQNGGVRHFEIQFIGYSSVATAYICTKFSIHTKTDVLLSAVTSHKI